MLRNNRIAFVLAVLILLLAALLRFWQFTTLPPGLHAQEIIDIRLADNARQGFIQVFYNVNGEGRDGFYPTLLAAVTTFSGSGLLGYHILSAYLGMITIALVFALARRLYGNLAGLASMALLAFGFFPALLSRQVGRETLLPLLTTTVLLAMAIGLPVYWRRRNTQTLTTSFAILGLLVGFGFYVHPAGLALALMVLLYIVYILLSRMNLSRQTLSYISFAALVALIVATPYLVSALRLPELGGVARLVGGFASDRKPISERVISTLLSIGIRGDKSEIYNLPYRPMFDPVTFGLMVFGVGFALRYFRKARFMLLLIALVTLLPLALFSPKTPSFIAFAAVLPVLAIFFGLGASTVVKLLRNRNLVRVAIAALTLLVAFIFFATWFDLFVQWPRLEAVQTAYNSRLAALAQRIDETADEMNTVVCTPSLNTTPPRPELTNAQIMSLMQHRTMSPNMRYVDCDQAFVFIDGGRLQQIILPEEDTLQTANPFILEWLARATPIHNGQVAENSVLMMEASSSLANTIGRFTTTEPILLPQSGGAQTTQTFPPVRMGGNLAFLGYQTPNVEFYPPGGIVTVSTYWRVDGTLPRDLRLFSHLLADPSLPPIAQNDLISVAPNQLTNRDVVLQVMYVPLSGLIPPGTYTVSTGAYQDSDQRRMDVLDENGSPIASRLFLYDITVRKDDTTDGD
jgi:4-amino-4-deoxy-L-arabinose transferase-like glycosyltransferase